MRGIQLSLRGPRGSGRNFYYDKPIQVFQFVSALRHYANNFHGASFGYGRDGPAKTRAA